MLTEWRKCKMFHFWNCQVTKNWDTEKFFTSEPNATHYTVG